MDNLQPSSNRMQDVSHKPFSTELQNTPAQGRNNKPFSSSVTMAHAHSYCKYWFRVVFSFQSLCVLTSAVWLRFGVKSDTPETLSPHQLLNKREQNKEHIVEIISTWPHLCILCLMGEAVPVFLLCIVYDPWALFSIYFVIKQKLKKIKGKGKK